MTKKERVQSILEHKVPDRLPSQANFTNEMRRIIGSHFSIGPEEVDSRFDNHLLRVDIDFKDRGPSDGQIISDWWGAGFDASEEGYRIARHPLAGDTALSGYPWPNPEVPDLLKTASQTISSDQAGEDPHFIIPNLGFALFERAWSLRGLEQFMMDLALEPVWAEELLEKITEIQIHLARRYVRSGVHGGYFGDDYGAQKGLLFSPQTWRSMFKPRLKRMFSVFTDAGLPVLMHSDGDIKEIIPDLIEIGLTCLNPCQPEILDHTWLKREYGSDLSFYGGLSTQEVLPAGSPAEVEKSARSCIDTLGSDDTGLIFGPSHRMMSDIPMENIDALLGSLAYCSIQ